MTGPNTKYSMTIDLCPRHVTKESQLTSVEKNGSDAEMAKEYPTMQTEAISQGSLLWSPAVNAG